MNTSSKKRDNSKTKIVLGIGIFLIVISAILFVTLLGKDNMHSVIASVEDAEYREAINEDYIILASGSSEERARLIFPSYGLSLSDESVNSILAEYGATIESAENETPPSNGVFTAIVEWMVITPTHAEKCSTGYKVTYEIEAPDLSNFIEDSAHSGTFLNSTDFSAHMLTYIADAEVTKYEASVEYAEMNGSIVGNYQTPEFVNAITGGLLEEYRDGYQEFLEAVMEVDK